MQSVERCLNTRVDHSLLAPGGGGFYPTPLNALALQDNGSLGLEPGPDAPGSTVQISDRGDGVIPPPPQQSGAHFLSSYVHYTANLVPSRPLQQLKTTPCQPKYVVYQCQCGRHILPSTCMNLSCETCAPHVGLRRAKSVFKRFHLPRPGNRRAYSNPVILYTIFTIPESIREKYRDKSEFQKLRRKIWVTLKDQFGGLFGMEATHPMGDKDDRFHPHINFVWVQRDGYRPYIDVHTLRTEWARILGAPVVDVHHQYTAIPAKSFHLIKYVCRVFVGYHWWTGSIRWYGKYPVMRKKFEYLCADCGYPFVRIGTISALLVSDYYDHGWRIGLDPPWYTNSNLTLSRRRAKDDRYAENDRAGNVCD